MIFLSKQGRRCLGILFAIGAPSVCRRDPTGNAEHNFAEHAPCGEALVPPGIGRFLGRFPRSVPQSLTASSARPRHSTSAWVKTENDFLPHDGDGTVVHRVIDTSSWPTLRIEASKEVAVGRRRAVFARTINIWPVPMSPPWKKEFPLLVPQR